MHETEVSMAVHTHLHERCPPRTTPHSNCLGSGHKCWGRLGTSGAGRAHHPAPQPASVGKFCAVSTASQSARTL